MTFPASFYTPARIIPLALKDAGLLQQGATAPLELLQDGLNRLGDMVATWQTQGIKLWLNSIQPITLTAGTASYTLGPGGTILATKPTRVIEGWYVLAAGNRYPLNPLSWDEHQTLGNLTTQGALNSYFVDKQQANLVVKVWQVPDTQAATGTVELLIQRQADSPGTLTETVLFPVEWYLALRWGLADEFATGQPALIMERCERKATMYRKMLEDWDVEDTGMRFQPSGLMGGSRRRFY